RRAERRLPGRAIAVLRRPGRPRPTGSLPNLPRRTAQGRMPSRWGRYRPHPSQSRTCRFPASGSSRERFARDGVAMEDPDCRKWARGQKVVEAGPCDHASTMTPRQPLAPDPNHLIGEPMQAPTVAANAIIGEVAPHHGGQVTMLVADRPVAVSPTPVINRGHRAGKPALGRHLPNPVLAVPGPPPDMG